MHILLTLVLWTNVPQDCDPIGFMSLPRATQEAFVEYGYLTWWQNCQIQKNAQKG